MAGGDRTHAAGSAGRGARAGRLARLGRGPLMRSLLLGVAGMWIAACAAQRLASAPPMPVPSPANLVILSPRPPPVSTPSVTPAPLRYLSYWQDASRLTKDHANVID